MRNQEVPVTRHNQGRDVNLGDPIAQVEGIEHGEPMGHDALVCPPALPSDELEQRARPLSAAEQQIEELVDEWIVVRQRKTAEHRPSDLLEEAAFKATARALDNQRPQASGMACGEFKAEDAAEGYSEERRSLQAAPVEELGNIGNQIL